MSTYPYNIATAFHGVEPNLNKLTLEIAASTISHTLTGTSDDGTDVSLTFDDSLSGPELTILDGIVDVHTPDVPFPYSKVTDSITTDTTDVYQIANTMNLYAFESDKYKIEFEFQITSTSTGMDVQITIDGNPIYANNQNIGGSVLSTPLNIGTFEIVDLGVGLHKLEIQFRRPASLSSSTIYHSRLLATNLYISV